MANVPSASDINQTHLGLQKQAVSYSEKVVAEKTAAQAKLDAEYSAAGDKVTAARTAYFNAKDNPNTSPAKLQELETKYVAAKDERATVGERAEANQAALEKAQSGLDSNKVALANSENALANGTGTSVTSPTPVLNDAQATNAEAVNTNTLPAGERVNADTPVVGGNNIDPGTDQTVAQVRAQNAGAPLTEPQQVVLSAGSSQIPQGPTLDGPANVSPNEDPFEASRLAAEEANNQEAPTEQQVIDAGQDAQLSQEEQGQLREYQATQRAMLKAEEDAANGNTNSSDAGSVDQVRTTQTAAIQRNSINKKDWRVRLSLAPQARYLYNTASNTEILYPLKQTDGVIFPYTPSIQTGYKANYENLDLTHSNYRMYFYKNSNVDDIVVTADFTAQDTNEANYLLAVIHFFRSVTKMFYGQDVDPKAGTPPPLVYLNGFGAYQFNEHPCLVSSFTYTLPNDVDYIRAGSMTQVAGTNVGDAVSRRKDAGLKDSLMSAIRRAASNLRVQGRLSEEPNWVNYANTEATYVPTKMQIQITLLPVVTRNDISKNFSVALYGTGQLTRGDKRPTGGGIW